uniref:Uncharacterized protein n=1 Tax=Romanomermis culicivorax TaxID=13658 RepID=A0A915IEP3_ROMCU
MSSSVSLRKSFIWVAEMVMSVVVDCLCKTGRGAAGGSFAMLRSKIGISRSSSLDGSRVVGNVGCSSNSSAVSAHAETVFGNGMLGALAMLLVNCLTLIFFAKNSDLVEKTVIQTGQKSTKS